MAPQTERHVARAIEDILNFRQDISPFLVHLTRGRPVSGPAGPYVSARDALQMIISTRELVAGSGPVAATRWGIEQFYSMVPSDERRFFGAICLTETPLDEVHSLLDVDRRIVNLEPYGLLFLKERFAARGVSPAIYLNNHGGASADTIQALGTLVDVAPNAAEALLPLTTFFGDMLGRPGHAPKVGSMDFRWEREWRYPAANGPLKFTEADVFVGLCPHEEIPEFEKLMPGVEFIDPRRNTKWYASKLVGARDRLHVSQSVV